jgi:polysaccharide export outer membrane protein
MSAMSSPFYYIQPNDFIYVKPLKQKSFGIGTNGFQTFTTLITTFTLILTTILIIAR